ncbi:type II secretion system protein [Chloroflexota bacterium]
MRLPKKDEKGFTLIELLIVVAILGVLAAVVIPNVGRFIGRGEDEAAETELSNMQSAVVAMMVDCGLSQFGDNSTTTKTGTNSTNNMNWFPSTLYPLFGNVRAIGAGGTAVNYVASNETKGTYSVDIYGTVTQNSTGYQ